MITEKLNDVFNPQEGGIFHYLQDFDVPWDEDEIDTLLDYEYHYNIAGQRFVSPLLHTMIDEDTNVLDTSSKEQIANIIYSMYGVRWGKLWATMGLVYNPIENYSMTEEMRNDITETEYGKRDTFTHGHTETETRNTTDTLTLGTTDTVTHNTTETETRNTTDTVTLGTTDTVTHNTTETETLNLSDTNTPNTSETSTSEVQGFNSSVYQPSEKTTVAKTGTDTTTHTGTDATAKTGTETTGRTGTDTTTHTGTDATAKTGTETTGRTGTEATAHTGSDTRAHTGNDVNAQSGTDTTERNYTLSRSGNIGVTTSQQMIESERALWMWDFFKDVVFPDINRVLTLSVY